MLFISESFDRWSIRAEELRTLSSLTDLEEGWAQDCTEQHWKLLSEHIQPHGGGNPIKTHFHWIHFRKHGCFNPTSTESTKWLRFQAWHLGKQSSTSSTLNTGAHGFRLQPFPRDKKLWIQCSRIHFQCNFWNVSSWRRWTDQRHAIPNRDFLTARIKNVWAPSKMHTRCRQRSHFSFPQHRALPPALASALLLPHTALLPAWSSALPGLTSALQGTELRSQALLTQHCWDGCCPVERQLCKQEAAAARAARRCIRAEAAWAGSMRQQGRLVFTARPWIYILEWGRLKIAKGLETRGRQQASIFIFTEPSI